MVDTIIKEDVILRPDGSEITRRGIVETAIKFYELAYNEKLTDICDFSDGSEIRTLHESFSVELFALYKEAYRMAKMKFVNYAEGIYLDELACEYHLSRKQPRYASGVVTFTTSEDVSAPIEISKGTILLNVENGQGYVLKKTVVIYSSDTPYDGEVIAQNVGEQYNVEEGFIKTFQDIGSIRRNVSVTNNTPITGGRDAEDDESLRNRILEAKRLKSYGTVSTYSSLIKQNCPGVHDIQFVDPLDLVDPKVDSNGNTTYEVKSGMPHHYISDTDETPCVECTRVLFVNGYAKPCDNDEITDISKNTLKEVEEWVRLEKNVVIGHVFHVEQARLTDVYLGMTVYVTSNVPEDRIYEHLQAFFDGGTVETKRGSVTYPGVNIGQTVYKNKLLQVIENVPGVDQVDGLVQLKYNPNLKISNVAWVDNPDDTYTYVDNEKYSFTRSNKDGINFWGTRTFTQLTCTKGSVLRLRGKNEIDKSKSKLFDYEPIPVTN